MIAGSPSSEALNNGIAINKFRTPFIKNTEKLLVNGFGTAKPVKNENERMLRRFNVKKIEIKGIINVIEIVITKDGNEVVNGNAETSAALSANDVVLRFRPKERNNLSNIVKSRRRNFTRYRVKTTEVFSRKNASSHHKRKSGTIPDGRFHEQFIMNEVIFATKVGRSGNENKFDVSFEHGIIKTSQGQSRMNGLVLACCYM